MSARVTLVLVLAMLSALLPTAAHARDSLGDNSQVSGTARGGAVELNARDGLAAERAWLAAGSNTGARLIEFLRSVECGIELLESGAPGAGDCAQDIDLTEVPDCGELQPLRPLWSRERATSTSAWGPWRLVNGWSCPQDALPAFTAEDFRRLPLAPAQVTVQPAASTVLINIPTITMAAAPQQNLATDLLGYPVEVQATATTYTWDYGDGSARLVTTSPGHAYPHHDVHHSYARPGTYTITLTTTWSGQYRIAGSTAWLPVDGTATTVTTIPPITAVEQRTALVAEPCMPSTC